MKSARPLRHIAVIDVGKTNAKLALVDVQTLVEVEVVTQPNTVLDAPPYPHFDLERHWVFFVKHLARFHTSHGVDAISVTTHGAAVVLLDGQGALATPMLDYEYSGPDELASAYDDIRPKFCKTGSPRLPGGLNIGAQLHWLFAQAPSLKEKVAHIVTYPQYWGYRLTGQLACDVTSLGCHTDLWNPFENEPSNLVDTLDIANKLAPARMPFDLLGTLTPEAAMITCLPQSTPVACGIHDSNASLVPYLRSPDRPKAVVSTGTWVICMALEGEMPALNSAEDTLINVNAHGRAVPSARFMGGREFEVIMEGATAEVTPEDRKAVIDRKVMLLPAVVPNSGPFSRQRARWTNLPETSGQRAYALSLYLALMTQHCLSLVGAQDPVVIEGPFAQNADYLEALAQLRSSSVQISSSTTGTAIGAAMMLSGEMQPKVAFVHPEGVASGFAKYATAWNDCARAGRAISPKT